MSFHSLQDMIVAAATSVRPPERLTVSQGAEKFRFLNNPGSYVGPWRNDKTPYLVEPMDELTSLDFQGMIFAGPARSGKSDMFFNYLVTTAICDPADMFLLHMTQASARDWSQGDLARAFRHSKALGATLVPGRQNDNVHDKRFLSGMRLLIKWPTIAELSGKTIPRLWAMDYDRMTQDVDGEGTPYDQLFKRHASFKRFGMAVAESSPGFLVEDPKFKPGADNPHEAPPTQGILKFYNRGDRRRWRWRCHQCGEAFEPTFQTLKWPDSADFMEAAEQAYMVCPYGCVIGSEMKQELNTAGRWVKEGQVWMPDGSMAGKARRSNIASFWMKGPAAAFQDWSGLVLNYLNAKSEFDKTGDEQSLKTTVTLDQGDPYTPEANKSDRLPEDLKNRAEDWGSTQADPTVPEWVRFLTAEIDVQAGGRPCFVVQVHGHGEGNDTTIVDMFKIRKSDRIDENDSRGDYHLIDPAAHPEDWHVLIPQVFEKTYPLADGSGRRMQIRATGSDSGGKAGVTSNAYKFWRYLREGPKDPVEREAFNFTHKDRFFLLKGAPSKTNPRIHLTFPDAERKDRFSGARGDEQVWLLNSDLLKDQVNNKLGRLEPGGGMIRYPTWSPDWLYSQLTAENRTATGWADPKKGRRNESWDLLYYAEAMCLLPVIRIETIDWTNPPGWAQVWDKNDLVIAAGAAPRFGDPPKVGMTMEELAEELG